MDLTGTGYFQLLFLLDPSCVSKTQEKEAFLQTHEAVSGLYRATGDERENNYFRIVSV